MQSHPARGYTLLELLVVIAIIGVLIALLLPAVQAACEAARRSQCTDNLRQLGIAMPNHHSAVGTFPPGIHDGLEQPWSFQVLPYLEQQALSNALNISAPFADARNTTVTQATISVFMCPSDPGNRTIMYSCFPNRRILLANS